MAKRIDFTPYNKICVIGAPGAGKTFFARVLAQSLGRVFFQFDEVRFGPRCSGGGSKSPGGLCAAPGANIKKQFPVGY